MRLFWAEWVDCYRIRQANRRASVLRDARSVWRHLPVIALLTVVIGGAVAGVTILLVGIFTGRLDFEAGIIAFVTMGTAVAGCTIGGALAWPQ